MTDSNDEDSVDASNDEVMVSNEEDSEEPVSTSKFTKDDLVQLLCTPQLLMCVSLVVKKMFSGFKAYSDSLGEGSETHEEGSGTLAPGHHYKDIFLKRISSWQTEVDYGLVIGKYFDTRPKFIQRFLTQWDTDCQKTKGAKELHASLLRLISNLFLECQREVGPKMVDEMSKWFDLMETGKMFEGAENLKVKFVEGKNQPTGDSNMEELVFFDYRAVFYYSAHIVYLEWEQPFHGNDYLLKGVHYNLMDDPMRVEYRLWAMTTAKRMKGLFPAPNELREPNPDKEFNCLNVALLGSVPVVQQVWDSCLKSGVLSILEYHKHLCTHVQGNILTTPCEEDEINMEILCVIEDQLNVALEQINHISQRIKDREKFRTNYNCVQFVHNRNGPKGCAFNVERHLGI